MVINTIPDSTDLDAVHKGLEASFERRHVRSHRRILGYFTVRAHILQNAGALLPGLEHLDYSGCKFAEEFLQQWDALDS